MSGPLTGSTSRFSSAAIEIAQGRLHRIETLLQPAVHAFDGLFPKVSDVVHRDDRLNVGGQAVASRFDPAVLACNVDLNSLVHYFVEPRPIEEIPGASVDLVDDNPCDAIFPPVTEHLLEDAPASLGCRELLLVPAGDHEVMATRVLLDRRSLLLKRHSLLSLFRCRNTHIAKVVLHGLEY